MDRAPSPIMVDVIERLGARGVQMDVIDSERALVNLEDHRPSYDWYLLKGGSASALTLGGMLHTLGARLLHSYPTTVILRNKLVVMQALRSRGLPVPATYYVTQVDDIRALFAAGPVILKPNDGRRGEGIRVVWDATELNHMPIAAPMLVQRYCPPDGPHPEPGKSRFLKAYRIGNEIHGVWRTWPLGPKPECESRPCAVSFAIREMVMAIGDVFDISLYGVDFVFSGGRPYVVDVIPMGSCTGVPDAARLLADYFFAACGSGSSVGRRTSGQ
jgi:glutathione synthase/RimK-type ligase-like ATP-grasp enzyme